MEALFVDRLKIVDVAELEEYTGCRLRQGERAAVTQSENDVLSLPDPLFLPLGSILFVRLLPCLAIISSIFQSQLSSKETSLSSPDRGTPL